MAEQNGKDDRPDEIQRLSERVAALERRVERSEVGALRSRVVSLGLAVGAMALFLSFSLPWLRLDRGFGLEFNSEGDLSLSWGSARGMGTGWELLAAAVDDGRPLLIAAMTGLLLTAALAIAALFIQRLGLYVTLQVAGLSLPVLLMLVWPPVYYRISLDAGGGPWAAAVASVLVAIAAFSAGSDIDRPGNTGPAA